MFYKRDLRGLLTSKYKILLEVGRTPHLSARRLPVAEFRAMEVESRYRPVQYLTVGDRTYWRHAGRWHSDSDGLTQVAVHALLVTRGMRQGDEVKRALTIAAMGQTPKPARRGTIPPDVRQLVWERDRGACRACGTNVELQFDHVLPISVGGGSTEDNLQILCGPCHRRKGASIS